MIPSCSHTGTPSGFDGFRHFTSSTTSGSASLMTRDARERLAAPIAKRPYLCVD
jgi:hypothetical protein